MKKLQAIFTISAGFVLTICLFACSGHSEEHNILTDLEKKDGWNLLFDGTSLNGWHLFNRGNIASAWSADSGNLVCNPHAKDVKHGDLVSDKQYENFDLSFEWKISRGG